MWSRDRNNTSDSNALPTYVSVLGVRGISSTHNTPPQPQYRPTNVVHPYRRRRLVIIYLWLFRSNASEIGKFLTTVGRQPPWKQSADVVELSSLCETTISRFSFAFPPQIIVGRYKPSPVELSLWFSIFRRERAAPLAPLRRRNETNGKRNGQQVLNRRLDDDSLFSFTNRVRNRILIVRKRAVSIRYYR